MYWYQFFSLPFFSMWTHMQPWCKYNVYVCLFVCLFDPGFRPKTPNYIQFSIPTSRNAFDRVLPEFHYGMSKSTACTCANNGPCTLGSARKEGGAGQPCLWWSQGCSIGCDYCLTDPRHPINNGTIPTTPINGNPPHADKAGFRKSYCENPKTQDVLPKEYWTMNIHAIPRAKNDSYRCK